MPAMPTTTDGSTRGRARRLSTDDTTREPRLDVSSPANDGTTIASSSPWSAPSAPQGHEGHERVAVGPGLSVAPILFPPYGFRPVSVLPVRADKIEPPYVRPDTLSRRRLNIWLDRAARSRLALVIGDTGFGKTTFLSDWSSQTPRHTSWYRLEHDDRDWLTLIRHLVAGGRKVDPDFAPDTYRLLSTLGPGGPTKDEVVEALARDMAGFGAASPHGFSLILDDFQAIEGSEETDPIIAALLESTGNGFSMILAARTAPQLPPVRLKGRNAVQHLEGDQLRFDVPETEALFRDAYGIPLDHDVAVDLVARTEGWAALLSLVRTRLEECPEPDPRALVAQLSAAEGDLYDFLAEEVLAEAPLDLAEFLADVSILDEVTIPAATAAVGSQDGVAEFLRTAESLGLLQRAPGSDRWHFAQLVREFLYAHLEQTRGRRRVREMHAAVAASFSGEDWRIAARQYVLAGQPGEAAHQIGEAIDAVLGVGDYRTALDLLSESPDDSALTAMLRARYLLQLGASEEALEAAEAAVRAAEENEPKYVSAALRIAATVAIGVYNLRAAADYGRRAIHTASTPAEKRLAECQLDLLSLGSHGNLPSIALKLEQLLATHERSHQSHYEAISAINLSAICVWLRRTPDALRLCSRAEHLLSSSSRGYEQVTVTLTRARACAFQGQWREAEKLINEALTVEHPEGRVEAVIDAAWMAAWFGPSGHSREYLRRARWDRLPGDRLSDWLAAELWDASDHTVLTSLLDRVADAPTDSIEVGGAFSRQLAKALAYFRLGDRESAEAALRLVERTAEAQASPIQRRLADLQRALQEGPEALAAEIAAATPEDDAFIGVYAREIAKTLGKLSPAAYLVVVRAARLNPDRWRTFLRPAVEEDGGNDVGAERAAAILDEIGEIGDIARLRAYARRMRRPPERWGEALARRLAPRVWIEDLGLARICVGDRVIDGRSIRRRALALLLYLLGQPAGAATPDQIIEALWPDVDPDAALNSVHQTIYVLRRVVDPDYKAGTSPEYLHFDSDMVWLDKDLVDSRSWRCMRLLSGREWDAEQVNEVVANYRGRFGADFAYDEWASPFRDRLHALYLSVMEQAVAGKIGHRDARWRLWVGQQAIQVDPEADSIEALVIGLYQAVDATSAAREQYAHYASAMRDQLGVDPPALEDMLLPS